MTINQAALAAQEFLVAHDVFALMPDSWNEPINRLAVRSIPVRSDAVASPDPQSLSESGDVHVLIGYRVDSICPRIATRAAGELKLACPVNTPHHPVITVRGSAIEEDH